jgi:hypothetical protein
MFAKIFFYLILPLLISLAIWEEYIREKRTSDLKIIFTEFRKTRWYVFSLLQRVLDYLFNKLTIRQFLNPWFFFPMSIFFSIYFHLKISQSMPDLILLVTFFALMWYARETFALRQEQIKNNVLIAGRPLLIMAKEVGNKISIKNMGNNIARNADLEITINNNIFLKVSFIAFGIDQKIMYDISEKLVNQIDNCNNDLRAMIRYRDFQNNNRYKTTFKLNKNIVVESGIGRFELIEDVKI